MWVTPPMRIKDTQSILLFFKRTHCHFVNKTEGIVGDHCGSLTAQLLWKKKKRKKTWATLKDWCHSDHVTLHDFVLYTVWYCVFVYILNVTMIWCLLKTTILKVHVLLCQSNKAILQTNTLPSYCTAAALTLRAFVSHSAPRGDRD